MSIAKQCDICGVFYEPYNVKNNAENTNGLMFINIDGQMDYITHNPIDCCPTCMNYIRKHIEYLKKLEKEK